MATLTDPDRLAAYLDALRNWRVSDFIQYKLNKQAHRWIKSRLGNITLKELGELMFEHMKAGGEVEEVIETRVQWSELYEFHHDIRLNIGRQSVYIETRLHYRIPVLPDESWILVVNVHEC